MIQHDTTPIPEAVLWNLLGDIEAQLETWQEAADENTRKKCALQWEVKKTVTKTGDVVTTMTIVSEIAGPEREMPFAHGPIK